MKDPLDTSAPQEPPRHHVRVRRRHRHFSTYNQFGVSRRDIALGVALIAVVGAALVWFLYASIIRGQSNGPDDTQAVPNIDEPAARF